MTTVNCHPESPQFWRLAQQLGRKCLQANFWPHCSVLALTGWLVQYSQVLNIPTVVASAGMRAHADAVQCSRVKCSAIKCNALQYNAVQCNTVKYGLLQCTALLCNTVQCSKIQCTKTQCCVIQWSAVQYRWLNKRDCKLVHQSQFQNFAIFTSHIWSILWKKNYLGLPVLTKYFVKKNMLVSWERPQFLLF